MGFTPEQVRQKDPVLGKNLVSVLQKYVSSSLGQTFAWKNVPLVPGGENINVTNENKKEFVKLACRQELFSSIEPQMNSFFIGFDRIFPHEMLYIFSESELDQLICGVSNIDVDDLQRNTELKPGVSNPAVLNWFWQFMREASEEEKSKILYFTTGVRKPPMGGFAHLQPKFSLTIKPQYGLPSASTCFSLLKLAPAAGYEEFKKKLLTAVMNTEGFELS